MLALFRVGGQANTLRAMSLLTDITGPGKIDIVHSCIGLMDCTHILHLIMGGLRGLNHSVAYEHLRLMYNQSIAQGQNAKTLPCLEEWPWPHTFPTCKSPWCHQLVTELQCQVMTSRQAHHNHHQQELRLAPPPPTIATGHNPFLAMSDPAPTTQQQASMVYQQEEQQVLCRQGRRILTPQPPARPRPLALIMSRVNSA